MSKVLVCCKWNPCAKKANATGYCGKHASRGILLDQAKRDGRRICDDGKRSCKNYTEGERLKCEECLEKNRTRDSAKYEERKNTLNMCLGCGVHISKLLDGILGHKVQRCEGCYSKLRTVEEGRVRNRNYAAENLANLDKHYSNYLKGASLRNMAFEISFDEFKKIVKMPCHYCNSYNETEVIGIDRVNSLIHYTMSNCVPCCQTCNYMKSDLSRNEFISHIHKIANYYHVDSEKDAESTRVSSMIPPKKVVELYKYGKINEFVEACIKDNRHPNFIERLKGIDTKMTVAEFKVWFRLCCRTDAKNMVAKENIKCKQVCQKDIYALLNTKNLKLAIDTYISVHGDIPGFKDEIEYLSKNWETYSFDERTEKIKKIMIKYRNIRAYSASKGDASEVPANIFIHTDVPAAPEFTPAAPAAPEFIPVPAAPAAPAYDSAIKQWKTSNIYRCLVSGNHTSYLEYLKQNNPDVSDIDVRLSALVESIQGLPDDAELKIKTFIEDLRTIRHNALCYAKNESLLLRSDREYWNTQSVLRAFNANMLAPFKEHTETNTGESADNPIWSKRWNEFVKSVSNEADLTKKRGYIQKFLTAQRTKKYRKARSLNTPD